MHNIILCVFVFFCVFLFGLLDQNQTSVYRVHTALCTSKEFAYVVRTLIEQDPQIAVLVETTSSSNIMRKVLDEIVSKAGGAFAFGV